jgi:transcriptional regulator with XRE-family HTH domain
MANVPIELGPSGERAAQNIKRLRLALGLDLAQLSERLGELGRPIGVPALSRVENGARRIDVSDLVALSIALKVTPNALLFGTPQFFGPDKLAITPSQGYEVDRVWRWADGEFPLEPSTPKEQLDFQMQARPHYPPEVLHHLPSSVRGTKAAQDLERAYKAAAEHFAADRRVLDLLTMEIRRESEQFDVEKWIGDLGEFSPSEEDRDA